MRYTPPKSDECHETGGIRVELTSTADLNGRAELASIDWTVNGNTVESGTSITPFLALGSYPISITATGVSGIYDAASTTENVIDTVKPYPGPEVPMHRNNHY